LQKDAPDLLTRWREVAPLAQFRRRLLRAPDPADEDADQQCAEGQRDVAPDGIHDAQEVRLTEKSVFANQPRHIRESVDRSGGQRGRDADHEGDETYDPHGPLAWPLLLIHEIGNHDL